MLSQNLSHQCAQVKIISSVLGIRLHVNSPRRKCNFVRNTAKMHAISKSSTGFSQWDWDLIPQEKSLVVESLFMNKHFFPPAVLNLMDKVTHSQLSGQMLMPSTCSIMPLQRLHLHVSAQHHHKAVQTSLSQCSYHSPAGRAFICPPPCAFLRLLTGFICRQWMICRRFCRLESPSPKQLRVLSTAMHKNRWINETQPSQRALTQKINAALLFWEFFGCIRMEKNKLQYNHHVRWVSSSHWRVNRRGCWFIIFGFYNMWKEIVLSSTGITKWFIETSVFWNMCTFAVYCADLVLSVVSYVWFECSFLPILLLQLRLRRYFHCVDSFYYTDPLAWIMRIHIVPFSHLNSLRAMIHF